MKITFLNAISMTVAGSYIFHPVKYSELDFYITAMSIDYTNGLNDIRCSFTVISTLNGSLAKITLTECVELFTNTKDVYEQERLMKAFKRNPNYIYSIDEEQLKTALNLIGACFFCGYEELSFKNPKESAQRVCQNVSLA